MWHFKNAKNGATPSRCRIREFEEQGLTVIATLKQHTPDHYATINFTDIHGKRHTQTQPSYKTAPPQLENSLGAASRGPVPQRRSIRSSSTPIVGQSFRSRRCWSLSLREAEKSTRNGHQVRPMEPKLQGWWKSASDFRRSANSPWRLCALFAENYEIRGVCGWILYRLSHEVAVCRSRKINNRWDEGDGRVRRAGRLSENVFSDKCFEC